MTDTKQISAETAERERQAAAAKWQARVDAEMERRARLADEESFLRHHAPELYY